MADSIQKTRFRFWLWLIRVVGVIVPRRLRANWRREWEAELRHREELLAEWDRLDRRARLDLLRRSTSAFWDAIWLQPKRLEDEMFQDMRFGARMLLKSKGAAAVAALTLALGIGANTAIFSVIYGVLLKSLPYPEADRLMVLNEASKTTPYMTVSYLNLRDWQRQQNVFENITGYIPDSMILTGDGEPERLIGKYATANFFATLGAPLALGRVFSEEEDRLGGERVVILSHRVWQGRFNGDPNLIGRMIQLNGASHTVIGVTAADFDFYGRQSLSNDLFLPIGQKAGLDYMRDRGAHPAIYAIGRLKPGVTIEQARAEMKALAARLAREYPKDNADHTMELNPFLDDYVGDMQRPLWIIQAAVGLVLLIACANVANLSLARTASRRREIAVRMALGAGRARVVRQLLTESLLLAFVGGAMGTLLAFWGVRLLVKLNPDGLPRLDDVAVDWSVLGFTLLLSLLTGVIFGLAPALQTAKTDIQDTLKDGGRSQNSGGGRLRGALVIAEVALSLLLLIGAGLLFRSFWRVLSVDPGFDVEDVLTMRLRLPDAKYDTAEKMMAFYDEAIRRVAALPGVRSAAVTNGFPLVGAAINIAYSVEGQPAPQPGEERQCIVQSVSPAYHQVFGIGLLSGRYFTPQDNAGSQPVVIVDEDFARKHFPALPLSEVLGKRVEVGGDKLPWREIVGVVRHVRHYGPEREGQPEIYRLWSQMGNGWVAKRMNFMDLAVKTAAEPLGFVALIKREIQVMDKDQPLGNIRTMDSYLDESLAARRFTLSLLGLFAILALLFGAVGIYGVMAYTVTQRTYEIGIRLALGAQSGDVLKLVVRHGLALVSAGIALGLAGAFALTRMITSLLFMVSATDPVTFLSLSLLLAAVALLACWLPARRAMKVDPLVAIRHD
ncbi:MAG TPA: ABC transporter permease [Blastocatellia bacterium]|nr:ABC transporter permease [Blastocatellia bacterium]